MNDIDKQIELIKLQIELARIKNGGDDNMVKRQETKANNLSVLETKPSKTLREIVTKICNEITFTDVIHYSNDMNTPCTIFEENYPCFDKAVVVTNDKVYYVYDINPETKQVEWFKVTRMYLVDKILKRIDNALIKNMWIGFTQEDKEWFKNPMLNERNMITSHSVLTNSGREDEIWLSMMNGLLHVF